MYNIPKGSASSTQKQKGVPAVTIFSQKFDSTHCNKVFLLDVSQEQEIPRRPAQPRMCEGLISAHSLLLVDDEQLGDKVLGIVSYVLEEHVGHVVLAAHDLRPDLPKIGEVQDKLRMELLRSLRAFSKQTHASKVKEKGGLREADTYKLFAVSNSSAKI